MYYRTTIDDNAALRAWARLSPDRLLSVRTWDHDTGKEGASPGEVSRANNGGWGKSVWTRADLYGGQRKFHQVRLDGRQTSRVYSSGRSRTATECFMSSTCEQLTLVARTRGLQYFKVMRYVVLNYNIAGERSLITRQTELDLPRRAATNARDDKGVARGWNGSGDIVATGVPESHTRTPAECDQTEYKPRYSGRVHVPENLHEDGGLRAEGGVKCIVFKWSVTRLGLSKFSQIRQGWRGLRVMHVVRSVLLEGQRTGYHAGHTVGRF